MFTQAPDGGFARTDIPLESGGQTIAAGDVDGDGDTDLVTADTTTAQTLWILRQDGPGAFTPVPIRGQEASTVELADIDRDGDLDIALHASLENGPRFLMNDGAGRFSEGVTFALSWGGVNDFAIADLNGDGALDLAVSDLGNPNDRPSRRQVSILTDTGVPAPECGGRTPTILGTEGYERISVQADTDDVVSLLGGDDRAIAWSEGRDVYCAGDGNDRVDVLEGAGAKRVYGGPGDDRIGSLSGRIRSPLQLFGEAGDDALVGGPFADVAAGGSGNDVATGGKGEDRLRGNAGRDKLTGEEAGTPRTAATARTGAGRSASRPAKAEAQRMNPRTASRNASVPVSIAA